MTDPVFGNPAADTASVTGRVWIHSAPAALCPHIEWAFAAANINAGSVNARDRRVRPAWGHQVAAPTGASGTSSTSGTSGAPHYCCEVELQCSAEAVRGLVANLMRWEMLTFEVGIDAPSNGMGQRICVTPELGYFEGATDEVGNLQVGEMQLRSIMSAHGHDAAAMSTAIDAALGGPWDRALEPLRMGAAGFSPADIAAMCQPQTDTSTQRLRAV
ncbi:DUF3145 family protein [Corynebacterium ulceribovis]|uniref:DUF3145 family protein n=1 Tax=Corynebacterium ulceribovis TaxID=487732 RepID=UPI000363B348|nr:DUF3145 family protein [Corynebacterium ulceribovis]